MKKVMCGVLLATLGTLAGCAHTVDTGDRGIRVSFGQVEGDPLTPGLYWYNPFTTTIYDFDTRVQKADGKFNDAYTHDVQQTHIGYTLNYQLHQAAVGKVYQTYGTDWENKLIPQVVHQDVKDVVSKWDATDLIANRQKASDDIQSLIIKDLASKDIDVTGFFLTSVTFSPEFNQAVEQKVIAAQQALQAQNVTQTVKQQAQQKVIAAQAEAESMQIRAKALESNPKLVEWEAVQKWNGKLPTNMFGNTVPFLNLGTVGK